jgi:hypothetical protein
MTEVHGSLHDLPIQQGSFMMYPPLAASVEQTQTSASAAPDTVTVETEIAALIKKAGESLRDQSGPAHASSKQVILQSPAADPNEADECPASPPKNFDFRVNDARLVPQIWDVKISDAERILDSSHNAKTTRTALLAGILFGTLGTGAIFGLVLHSFDSRISSSVEQKDRSKAQVPASTKTSYGTPETELKSPSAVPNRYNIATLAGSLPAHRLDFTQSAGRRPAAAQQTIGSSGSAASGVGPGPKTSNKPMSFPETKPTTIEGWSVRDVVGGSAILEGPNGVWTVTRGDTVPGVGPVNAIVRWGSHWIVATNGGLISTP